MLADTSEEGNGPLYPRGPSIRRRPLTASSKVAGTKNVELRGASDSSGMPTSA